MRRIIYTFNKYNIKTTFQTHNNIRSLQIELKQIPEKPQIDAPKRQHQQNVKRRFIDRASLTDDIEATHSTLPRSRKKVFV